ncbi:MAG: glycosyltransferase family 4 protein [Chthoniobacteraceae bacterium]
MNALFAPDWRAGVPYQKLLADALNAQGVTVDFLSHYRRGFPLWRGVDQARHDVFHLHWPEAYYAKMHDRFDGLRNLRFAFDLAVATRRLPLVLTAHNLLAHNRGHERLAHFNMAAVARRASGIIAHSEAAAKKVASTFSVDAGKITVIPHGDLSVSTGAPVPREEARAGLGIGHEKICLMFGTVEPYKGLEEIIALWKQPPTGARLVIVGRPNTKEYGAAIASLCADNPAIDARLGWLEDDELHRWLSAADAVIFNYRTIFTSGAACTARSYGLPILLPSRLDTVDLGEPHPLVLRFEPQTFQPVLQRALETPPDYTAAAAWRALTAWDAIATRTAQVYREAIDRFQKTVRNGTKPA